MADTRQQSDATAQRQTPPATVFTLVDMFVNQAYMALGAIKDPKTEKPMIDLEYAKHSIDILELLQQKTNGNLSAPEKNYMDNMLYQIRMTFVRMKSNPPAEEPEADQTTDAEDTATETEPQESDDPTPEPIAEKNDDA